MTDQTKSPPTLDNLRARRDEILALAERYGAYNVRVFGSVARGEASADSDVDLLVSFREDASLYDLSGLWQEMQELLGCKVNIISEGGLRDRFQKRIQPDLVTL